jgi:hypothetical protein
LQRQARDITPSLNDYLATLHPEAGASESVPSNSPAEPARGRLISGAPGAPETHAGPIPLAASGDALRDAGPAGGAGSPASSSGADHG